MPKLEWTTEEDFEAGSTTGSLSTSESPGNLVLTDGSGTWTSEARQGASWVHWGVLRIPVSLPEGANVYARVKTAASEGGLSGASWTSWQGALADTGEIRINVGALLLNEGITPGAWYQVQLTLLKG